MLVKVQILSLSVLIYDSLPHFSLRHAAPLPLVCHLPPSCWGAEMKWGGKEIHVRFGIAIDKTCRVGEMIWHHCWKAGTAGSWATLYHHLCFLLLYCNGQLYLPHALYHEFPCQCQPLVIFFCTWSVLWARMGSAVTFDQMGVLREDSGFQDNLHFKGPAAPGTLCVAQGCSCQMS